MSSDPVLPIDNTTPLNVEVANTTVDATTEGVADAVTDTAGGKGTRSFKVKLEPNGPLYGRYNGDSPYQAANKALSEIIRNRVKNNQNSDEQLNFYLVESTKGSLKKSHQYEGRRVKLDAPVQYQVAGGQMITKEFKNVLRKVKKVVQRGTRRSRNEVQTATSSEPVILSSTDSSVTVQTSTVVQTI